MKTGHLIRDLPPAFNQGIGAIIVAYAGLEHLLSSMAHYILDVDHADGRIAVRQPRGPDRLTMILDLLEVRDITLKFDIASLQTRVAECHRQRDQIAHGIWMLDAETKSKILLRLTRGTWRPDPTQEGKGKASRET